MKKIIYLVAACLILGGAGFYLNKNEVKVESVLKTSALSIQKTANKIVGTTYEANNIVEKVLVAENVPTVEEIESDLLNSSDEEIKEAIAQNDKWSADKKLIARANAGEINQTEQQELLKYIRMNTALNKILMERQLDELESEKL